MVDGRDAVRCAIVGAGAADHPAAPRDGRARVAPHFFDDPDFDFTARTALGHAALGTSDIGPILEVLSRIEDGDAAGCTPRGFAFRARPYGGDTPYDVFAAAQRFTLRGVTDSIRTPLLITDPDDESFFPGQPQELYDLLPGEKEIVRFTREQGADRHCEPLARGLVGHVMCDFFAAHMATARTATAARA
jgi:hypothetical protein